LTVDPTLIYHTEKDLSVNKRGESQHGFHRDIK
jgi:hypothetical protein